MKEIFIRYKHQFIIFLIGFVYFFFLTATVPLFWEEQVYQSQYVQEPTEHWIKEIFFGFGKNNIFQATRPFDALLFKILFTITGYNYVAMRFFKALLFGICIMLIFEFVRRYMKNSLAAYCTSIFFMCSLSLYIHTLVFAEPYLLTEVLKLSIFFLFLADYFSEKSLWINQFFIALLFLLSIRTYMPAYSTIGIFILFTLFYNWRKIKHYAALFLFFIICALPWPLQFQIMDGSSAYAPKLWSIQHFFLNDIIHYITSPLISLEGLYYKPFFAIITFFGFWLIVLFIGLSIALLCKNKIKLFTGEFIPLENKWIILFLLIWLVCELPLWIILPEHATRYANSILLPFLLLMTFMIIYVIKRIKQEYQKYVTCFVLVLVLLAVLTNLAYVTAFRAGWGSSFIAIEKTQDFIVENKEGKSIVFYFGQSVAEEYYAINKSNKNHELISTLTFKQVKNIEEFDEEDILIYEQEYETIYVLKRITSGETALPNINFDEYSSLEQVEKIEGRNEYDPFDIIIQKVSSLGVLHYSPNYIYIYRLKKVYDEP